MQATRHEEGPERHRVALVGTGHRGAGMWGKELLQGWRDRTEFVAICDVNEMRATAARTAIGTNAPVYTDVDEMLASVKPEIVIVCSRDDTHDEIIVKALEAGCRVITEKPMTTTPEKCRRILEAEARTGRPVDVTFNYRFAPTAARIKQLLREEAVGTVTSVDFHWYLDTQHGADYFRRWHAKEAHSGSLFVHKATHHFDLLNWYLESVPREVSAFGTQRNYGRNGPFRGERCQTCSHARDCDFYFDMSKDPWLTMLYEDPSAEDGYVRDACVYREDIDIADTMTAMLRFENEVIVSYSLNTFMPIEGYHLAFNGTKGRIEVRQYERQAFETPDHDEILLMRNFGGVERIRVPHAGGGHFGGDDRLRDMLLRPGMTDPLGQRAGALAGAMSMLCGAAAVASMKSGRPVRLAELGGLPA
ncbi:4,5-dihydroxyphthalate dehydrogenase [Labrys okinawensis]|uniref:4,5-dihydroxyphthalate dehydrogenase n=1 Tax=Labrys okinawensis TaxID=346911 RepID=A0A2S9QE85_9HYPH|nr:Gfo/Idh/MocA family oxidoreductase [Labrys okinawensis]PRH87663.1 4,5-dihydroxyphthalate dehydrogenase [Labrys okinawensis]